MGTTQPAAIEAAQDLRQVALDSLISKDYDKAIECYNTLLSQNPPDALSIKVDLGICWKFKKDYAKAMALFAEVGRIEGPRQAEALFLTEDCINDQKKHPEAVAYLQDIYAKHPALRPQALIRLSGRYCDDLHQYAPATAALEEILKDYPDSPEAIPATVGKAEILLFVDRRPAEAREILEKFVEEHPDYPDMICVRRNIASCALQEGKYAEAAGLFEEALKLPETGTWHPFLMYMAAYSYKMSGDREKATATYNALIERFPEVDWAKAAADTLAAAQARLEAAQ